MKCLWCGRTVIQNPENKTGKNRSYCDSTCCGKYHKVNVTKKRTHASMMSYYVNAKNRVMKDMGIHCSKDELNHLKTMQEVDVDAWVRTKINNHFDKPSLR